MSFQDIERGLNAPHSSSPLNPANAADAPNPNSIAFQNLQQSLSIQVFKINANVQGIMKLVDQLGTARDTGGIRKALHDLTEATREMVKRGTEDLKKLAALQADLPQHKPLLQKTAHDFQLSLVAFQKAQKVSAERQRSVVEGVKAAVVDRDELGEGHELSTSPSQSLQSQLQTQAQIQAQALSPADLAYQESLIQEREHEIHSIETNIHELNEMFRDLGTIVVEQGGMLDNIESNVRNVARDTGTASSELTQASEYQRRAGRRMCCLMIIIVTVVCIVLLAILS